MSNSRGAKLRDLRINAGETLKDVANAVGLTASSISAYELGTRNPSDDVKAKLAKHFNRTVGFIFFTDHTHNK